ncbi:MAG: tetratricopeptide repeat protein [Flavobacteriaceae bacterium]|nr:tetratricopeptide repeat protein [Flavobacteriaceae bacterium]
MMQSPINKIGLSTLFLLTSLLSFSQKQKQDSLLTELESNTKTDTIRARLLINVAYNIMHNKPQQALDYVDEALQISNELDWQKGKASSLRQIGVVYYYMADNIRAMDYFQQALIAGEPLHDKLFNASLYSNLANIFADMKQSERAIKEYNRLLTVAREFNHIPFLINSLSNIGAVYNEINEPDKALPYFMEALSIAKKTKNEYVIAAVTANLGLLYETKEEYPEALTQFKKAAEKAAEIDNKYIEASAINSIGKINLKLNNYSAAKVNSEKALKLAQEVNAVEWQADSWQVLSAVYEHQGDTKKALSAYKNYIQFKDSVLGEGKKVELTRKDMQFQLEKQETTASAEIKRQRIIKNNAIAGGALLTIMAFIGYILYKKKRDALEEKKIADFNTKVAETELKALRSQMNPHFIFNSLNSISDYMSKHDLDTANDYLVKFSKLTRAILENSEKKWVTLKEDLELMELYIQIETLRLKNKFSYDINVDKAIDIENTLVPSLILQPFIENSIWHGIAGKESKGHIQIEVKKENEMMVFSVEDDGVGRKKTSRINPENTSMGIKITKSRLDIINQLKNTKGSVEMIDKTKGLKVELKLPLELRF